MFDKSMLLYNTIGTVSIVGDNSRFLGKNNHFFNRNNKWKQKLDIARGDAFLAFLAQLN